MQIGAGFLTTPILAGALAWLAAPGALPAAGESAGAPQAVPHPLVATQATAGPAPADVPAAGHARGAGTYLIVYDPALRAAAGEWAAYRAQAAGGRWRISMHAAPELSSADETRREVQSFIRRSFAQAGEPGDAGAPPTAARFMVLLLGDADPGGGGALPSFSFPQDDPVMQSHRPGAAEVFISDHPYQQLDEKDAGPRFPLGRVPARTLEEARAVLAKTRQYEAALASGLIAQNTGVPGRARIIYAAGEGHFGVMDNVLESLFKAMVDSMVPDAFDISMTYAKASSLYCPPPSRLTQTVLDRLAEGPVLFNYIGHGYERGFDWLHWRGQRFPILRSNDVKRLPPPDDASPRTPVAFLSCCSVGCFDLADGEHGLAEALLFHPAGPVTVIAGSRVTHPYANTVLQKNITRALLVDRAPTAGDLDMRATAALVHPDASDHELDALAAPIAYFGKWKTNLRDLRAMHVKLYNLLGDPAVPISLPAELVSDIAVDDGRITGRVQGMASGRVTMTIEAARTAQAKPQELRPVTGEDDPDLEAKAAHNYALVNDRVLMKLDAAVENERFDAALAGALPASAAVIRCYAVGTSAAGAAFDAIGAKRLPPPKQPRDLAPDQ